MKNSTPTVASSQTSRQRPMAFGAGISPANGNLMPGSLTARVSTPRVDTMSKPTHDYSRGMAGVSVTHSPRGTGGTP